MTDITEKADLVELLRSDNKMLLNKIVKQSDEIERLRDALEGLLDACHAHNDANGKQMVDLGAEWGAREALNEKT